MDPFSPPVLPPERQIEVAMLKLAFRSGFAPVSTEALASELPDFTRSQLESSLQGAVRVGIARPTLEGWVLRGHWLQRPSTRHRLLLRE